MNILNEALDVFGDSVIKMHEFIFDQTDHNDFWAFIKKQNKKGVYIFWICQQKNLRILFI